MDYPPDDQSCVPCLLPQSVLVGARGLCLSTPPSLPSSVWPWLTGGNYFDNKGFGGLLCPKLGKSYFNGWICEKSSLGKESQVFQPRSMSAFQAKSDGGRLENRKSWLMPHNSG